MWIVLFVTVLIWIIYVLYFKDYFEVRKIFNVLEKTLDTRNLIVMKLVPEIKDNNQKVKLVNLIEKRIKNKESGYTEKMKLDIELNEELKSFYEIVSKKVENPLVKATLNNAVELEKSLKKIRKEYNNAVEKYNMNLVMHKFMCMRVIHMKPLDTYSII